MKSAFAFAFVVPFSSNWTIAGQLIMLITSTFAVIVIVLQFIVGFLIGLVISWAVLRSKLTWRLAITASAATACVFELAIGVTSWISMNQAHRWYRQVEGSMWSIIWTSTICAALVIANLMKARQNKDPIGAKGIENV